MIKNKSSFLRRITLAVIAALTLTANAAKVSYAEYPTQPAFGIEEDFALPVLEEESSTDRYSGLCADVGDTVYLGGTPFGVRLQCDGLLIIGFEDVYTKDGPRSPAKDAGLENGDIIINADGIKISSADDFLRVIERSGGSPVNITCKRKNSTVDVKVTPVLCADDGKYKTGMWLRDSTAGIGTITFVVPSNGAFAGLGHGICDGETGFPVPLSTGITSGVALNGIEKGVPGTPGELRGSFHGNRTGTLFRNTGNGVFGIFSDGTTYDKEKIPLGSIDDMREGDAFIRCTLDSSGSAKYSVSISEIHRDSKGNKNFIVTVTDKDLIDKTGGIVQGMSGSPIIQDGKLVGAVTHVLVNDPTRGYGIFIENMLDAAG